MLTKQRIHDMILQGHTYASIMAELGISERTLYRYLDIIFAQEQDLLNDTVTAEQLRRQVILCSDRLLQDRLTIKQWLKDDPNAADRVGLMNLAAELTAAVLRVYTHAPARFIRTEEHPVLLHSVVEAMNAAEEEE